MKIVNKYKESLAFCISEPDEGQSHALRKGFRHATGDVLTWLNTDDLLLPGALRKAARAFTEDSRRAWLLGNVVWIDTEDRIVKCWRGEGHTLGWMKLGIFAAGGPSAFFRRELYESVGGIALHLHYQMDTDLWWRFGMAGEKFHRLGGYIWALRLHEGAKVSGHMFSHESDAKQRKIAEIKEAEWKYIREQTSNFRSYEMPLVSPFLSTIRKVSSPAYIHGLIDHCLFRGKKLSKLIVS